MRKAKEYAEMLMVKLRDPKAVEGDFDVEINKVVWFLAEDASELIRIRKSKKVLSGSPSSNVVQAVVEEINQKWNAVASEVNRRFGGLVLKRDGFKQMLMERVRERMFPKELK